MLLLDTCVLLWLAADPDQLSQTARKRIAAASESLFVSSISAFEIAIKHKRKKLRLPLDPGPWFHSALLELGVNEIEPGAEILVRSAALPDLHADPCDRIIVATALIQSCPCLTPDALIHRYPGVDAVW